VIGEREGVGQGLSSRYHVGHLPGVTGKILKKNSIRMVGRWN